MNKYLLSLIKDNKMYLFGLVSASILASVFKIMTDYKIKQIVDNVTMNQRSGLVLLLVLYITYKTLHHLMFFIVRIFDMHYKPQLLTRVVRDIYQKTFAHSLHWFGSHLSGEISEKIFAFQKGIIDILTCGSKTVVGLFSILIATIVLFSVNLKVALIFVVFIAIHCPITILLLRKQIAIQREYVKADQEAKGIVNDSVANIFNVKIIGSLIYELSQKLTPALIKRQEADRKSRKFDAYFVDNADTIMTLVMTICQVGLLIYLFERNQITVGDFVFTIGALTNVHISLDFLLENIMFTITPAVATMRSSYEFIDQKVDVVDKANAIILPKVSGRITFNNVSFSYGKTGKNVFENLSLSIPSGQKIGIVGTSGGGKTTLIKCLLRYFDVNIGSITIDDYNIQNVTQESLRQNISVIPQDINLFHRTILENIKIGKSDATFDEIVSACKKAKIHDIIIQMEKGYDTIVGERGVKLSGGQRQRLAIAIAILKNAPILILDEATSSLDSSTETEIQKSIEEIIGFENITLIAIAHRLSTIRNMDRIIVLHDGSVIEDGAIDELLNKSSGHFKKLWDTQINGMIV